MQSLAQGRQRGEAKAWKTRYPENSQLDQRVSSFSRMTYGGRAEDQSPQPGHRGEAPTYTNFMPAGAPVYSCSGDCPPLHSARGPAQLPPAPPPSHRSHPGRPAQRACSEPTAAGHAGKCSLETGAGEPREVRGSRHLSSRLSRTPGSPRVGCRQGAPRG